VELQELQLEFESQLVNRISDMRFDIDRVVVTMAHVHPLNVDILSNLLNVSFEDSQNLLGEASELATVKILPNGQFKLHDEMQRLVNEYVWPQIDFNKSRRRHLSQRAMNVYKLKFYAAEQQLQIQIKRSKSISREIKQYQEKSRLSSGKRKKYETGLLLDALRKQKLDILLNKQALEDELWFLGEQFVRHAIVTEQQDEAIEIMSRLRGR
jgi:hypothetical protein